MSVNYLHKRTGTANKRPTAAQLDVGELSICYESGDPGVFFEDSSGNVRKLGPVTVGGTEPNASPVGSSGNSAGELWLDTTSSNAILKCWNGSAWVTIEGVATSSASDTEVLLSNSGVLTGDENFTFDSANDILSCTEFAGRLDGPVVLQAKSGEALSAGDVVYVSGVSGNFPVVSKAQANAASKMPAFGLVRESASGADDDVNVITLGSLTSFDTDTPSWSLGDTLYV